MELPFLKNKKNQFGVAVGPSKVADSTHPDEDHGMDDEIMDKVADEFLHAIETKDKKLMRDALSALVLHIQDEDKKQDEGESV